MLFEGIALYSDGFLKALHSLTEALESNALIDDVVSITNQDHIIGTDDGFLIEPLIDTRELDSSRPFDRMSRAIQDRFANSALVARDGSAVAMLVVPVDIDNSLERMKLEDTVLQEVDNARLKGYLTGIAGQIATDVAQMRSMLRDNMIFIPGTSLVGLFLVWWLFHRWLAVVVTGLVIGVIVSSTVAFYVLFNQPFNLISSIIPPLLSALTVAALVHLFNALHYASKRGLTGPDRVKKCPPGNTAASPVHVTDDSGRSGITGPEPDTPHQGVWVDIGCWRYFDLFCCDPLSACNIRKIRLLSLAQSQIRAWGGRWNCPAFAGDRCQVPSPGYCHYRNCLGGGIAADWKCCRRNQFA